MHNLLIYYEYASIPNSLQSQQLPFICYLKSFLKVDDWFFPSKWIGVFF